MKKIFFYAGFVLVILVVSLIFLIYSSSKPVDVITMLSKDQNLKVTSVEFFGNLAERPVSVVLTNSETLSYLAGAFRKATEDFLGGWSCFARVRLSNGKDSKVSMNIVEGGRMLDIGIERGPLQDAKHYSVRLSDPIPDELVKAIWHMTTAEWAQPSPPNAGTNLNPSKIPL